MFLNYYTYLFYIINIPNYCKPFRNLLDGASPNGYWLGIKRTSEGKWMRVADESTVEWPEEEPEEEPGVGGADYVAMDNYLYGLYSYPKYYENLNFFCEY